VRRLRASSPTESPRALSTVRPDARPDSGARRLKAAIAAATSMFCGASSPVSVNSPLADSASATWP
jgi:hypothetical protein